MVAPTSYTVAGLKEKGLTDEQISQMQNVAKFGFEKFLWKDKNGDWHTMEAGKVVDLKNSPPLPSQDKASKVATKAKIKSDVTVSSVSREELEIFEIGRTPKKERHRLDVNFLDKLDDADYKKTIDAGVINYLLLKKLGLPLDGRARIGNHCYGSTVTPSSITEWTVQELVDLPGSRRGRTFKGWADRAAPEGVVLAKIRKECAEEYYANVGNKEYREALVADIQKEGYDLSFGSYFV